MMNIFKLIFNPQSKFNTGTLLAIGIIGWLIGSLIGSLINVSFDGVFDIHYDAISSVSFLDSLQENTVNTLTIFVLLFGLGKIINSKTRWIDILTTSFLYRIPLYISAPITGLPVFERISTTVMENKDHLNAISFPIIDMIMLLIASLLLILFLIYSIVLLVNGFKTSTNSKKWQHYVLLTIVLIVSEIISKLIISNYLL